MIGYLFCLSDKGMCLPSSKERKRKNLFCFPHFFHSSISKLKLRNFKFQMSESEDLESLKVTELQNELKKRGLDTKGRKADLITRLRQAMNKGIEGNNVYII